MSEEDIDKEFYTFGEYVRKLRRERRFTLQEAAKMMGVTTQKLCDIESGRKYHKRINIDLLNAVSKAFGVPVAEIFSVVQTTLKVATTTKEVLAELLPLTIYSEMLSSKLKDECATYSIELEKLSSELALNVKKVKMLVGLIQSGTVTSKPIFRVD